MSITVVGAVPNRNSTREQDYGARMFLQLTRKEDNIFWYKTVSGLQCSFC